jgi:hypothetical protein
VEATPDDGDAQWGVDAAIGAAAIAARAATDVAGTVAGSAPAKALGSAARWLTQPLAKEGQEVRGRLEEEGVPAAQQAIRQLTPGVVQAVDLNGILDAIDIDGLLERISMDKLLDRIDVGGIVARVDIDGLLDSIDLDALLTRIDVNALVARIDLNQLLQHVDLNALLTHIDLNELLKGIDLDALLENLDLNAVVERLDVDALVQNTEMGGIIARSTSGVASEALDAVRSQGVGMDNFIMRMTNRVLRRDPAELPAGPDLLVSDQLALPAGEPAGQDDEPSAKPDTSSPSDPVAPGGPSTAGSAS